MTGARIETNERAEEARSQCPIVISHYSDYTPPFDPVPVIQRMLASVPPKYLVGLSEIVLTNSTGLSRKLRRSVTKSRKRKVKIVEARGLYRQAWHGKPAWIQIFVNNTLKNWGKGWWLRFTFFAEILLGDVLFHEIGHHIHFTARPEHREKEEVADDWMRRLKKNYFRTQRPMLRFVLITLRPILRPMIWLLRRKAAR